MTKVLDPSKPGRQATREAAMKHVCPTCRADLGEPCKTTRGTTPGMRQYSPHQDRANLIDTKYDQPKDISV